MEDNNNEVVSDEQYVERLTHVAEEIHDDPNLTVRSVAPRLIVSFGMYNNEVDRRTESKSSGAKLHDLSGIRDSTKFIPGGDRFWPKDVLRHRRLDTSFHTSVTNVRGRAVKAVSHDLRVLLSDLELTEEAVEKFKEEEPFGGPVEEQNA